ncbi:MAG: hypothetical protein GY934_02555 [Gammaproteobacteria bacterium]|nr:hypothetical protein [Gammaproteobacteria bacterium]
MKKLVIALCLIFSTVVSAQRLQQSGWDFIREGVATADSTNLIALHNAHWRARASQSRGIAIPRESQALLVAFVGDEAAAADPNDNTATVKFWMYRTGGSAQIVGTYTISIGGQNVVQGPRRSAARTNAHWADTITESSEYWIASPKVTQVYDDNVATLYIPTFGAAYVVAEVTVLGSGLTLDVMMSPVTAGFSDLDIAPQQVDFAQQTWANGASPDAKTDTQNGVKMLVSRIAVLINTPTNNNTVTIVITDEDSVELVRFTSIADATNHNKSGFASIQDFTPFVANNNLTVSIDPSADSGATSLTVDVKLYGR